MAQSEYLNFLCLYWYVPMDRKLKVGTIWHRFLVALLQIELKNPLANHKHQHQCMEYQTY